MGLLSDLIFGGSPTEDINFRNFGQTIDEGLYPQIALSLGIPVGEFDYTDIAPEGMISLLEYERGARKRAAEINTDVLRTTLFGESRVATEEGIFKGLRVIPTNPEAMGGYYFTQNADGSWVFRQPDGTAITHTKTWDQMLSNIRKGEKMNVYGGKAKPPIEVLEHIVTSETDPLSRVEEVYETHDPNTGEKYVAGNTYSTGGLYDFYAPKDIPIYATQSDVVAGKASRIGEQIGTRKAGYDETGKFQGAAAAEADTADYAMARRTAAMRGQGEIGQILEDVGGMVDANIAATEQDRSLMQSLRQDLWNTGLSDREMAAVKRRTQEAHASRFGVNTLRDRRAMEDEVIAQLEEDRTRRLQNTALAQQLLSQETQIGTSNVGQKMTQLGAEQATLGQGAAATAGAAAMLGTGAGLSQNAGTKYIDPTAATSFAQNQDALMAQLKLGEAELEAGMFSGLVSGASNAYAGKLKS